jgi:putative membrane protein
MKLGLLLAGATGLLLTLGIVVYFDVSDIAQAFLSAGWRGILFLTLAHGASLILCAMAWRALLVEEFQPSVSVCLWARWLRDSIGNILALLPVAGEVISARELTFHGVRGGMAGASTVVDLTMEIVSQILFTLLGLALLVSSRPEHVSAGWTAMGLAITGLAMAGFIVAQRKGLFRLLETLPERLGLTRGWKSPAESEGIHAALQIIYRQRARVLLAMTIHFAAWVVGASQAWVGLHFMGHPLGIADVLILESLIFALRSAAFFIPWAGGVQEAGYVGLGMLLGLTPDIALALSLLKRVREIITGVPCLLIWHAIEGKRLFSRA